MPRGGEVAGQRHRLGVPAPLAHPSQPLIIADSLECPQCARCTVLPLIVIIRAAAAWCREAFQGPSLH